MDLNRNRSTRGRGIRSRIQVNGAASNDRSQIPRPSRTNAIKSQNVAVLHPDADLMSGIRDALCPTLFPPEVVACPRNAQVGYQRTSPHVMNGCISVPAQDRTKKSKMHTVQREVKHSFAPRKFLCPPRNIQANTEAEAPLDANELDVLEQTLHGEGAIVRKYPPPECSAFQNLDALHQAVEDPDRFFGDFMGQGADPPVDLGEIENTVGDRIESCDDSALLCNDMANFDVGDYSPRKQFHNYALPLGNECGLATKPTSPPARPFQSAKTAPSHESSLSPQTLRNIESTIENQRNHGFSLMAFPLGNSATNASIGVANTNPNSYESGSFNDISKSLPTGLESPVGIQDSVVPLGDPELSQAVAFDKLLSESQSQDFARVSPEHGTGTGSFPQHKTLAYRTHTALLHMKDNSRPPQVTSHERPPKRVRDFPEPPPSPPAPPIGSGVSAARGPHENSRDNWDQLPSEIQAKIAKLRSKIAMMPRRKLRECLAAGITLEEIVPLMEVNRDDLASMLGLGVTTWKSFLHNELHVPRWPARALKSLANKTIDAQGRRDAAIREGEMTEEAAAGAEIEKLVRARIALMQQLREFASKPREEVEVEPSAKRRRPII